MAKKNVKLIKTLLSLSDFHVNIVLLPIVTKTSIFKKKRFLIYGSSYQKG